METVRKESIMAQVVQAKCPHCKTVLRIPAEWVAQPMKCKLCQQIFQAVAKPGAAATPASASVAAKTPLPNHNPALRLPNPPHGAPAAATPPRKSGLWKAAILFGVVLAIGAGVMIVAGPHLSGLFEARKKDDDDKKKPQPV